MFITFKIYLIFKYTTKFLFNPTEKKAQINLKFSRHIKVPSYLWVRLPSYSTLSCFKIDEWHMAHKWSKGRNKDTSNPIISQAIFFFLFSAPLSSLCNITFVQTTLSYIEHIAKCLT